MNELLNNHLKDLCSLINEMDEAGIGKDNEFIKHSNILTDNNKEN
jgi:hypothetical protein